MCTDSLRRIVFEWSIEDLHVSKTFEILSYVYLDLGLVLESARIEKVEALESLEKTQGNNVPPWGERRPPRKDIWVNAVPPLISN